MKQKSNKENELIQSGSDSLFQRVTSILDQARNNVVRSVNTNMVLAYWLIGREIVQAFQGGEERAAYGKQRLENLSKCLTEKYGKGFSVTNLKYFRLFYQVYPERLNSIGHTACDQLSPIRHPTGAELVTDGQTPNITEELSPLISSNLFERERSRGFSLQLSWSHYRALMRVQDVEARDFYEREAVECGWSKVQLERQIQSAYYQRIIANRGEAGLDSTEREKLPGELTPAAVILKTPYVLEFLGLPHSADLRESTMEQAIIDNLQSFLLELGKGFSFVGRQKHMKFDDDDFYVDLVFYNFLLKCFLLVDLKIGKLTHRDVGQMDGYVRLYEDCYKVPGDNPTIGLILCSDKTEAVAKYSVLSEGRQIFASKYLQFLPSEQELMLEIQRERKTIEAAVKKSISDGKID